jgi:DNA-binding MarR family transcriptional regulator
MSDEQTPNGSEPAGGTVRAGGTVPAATEPADFQTAFWSAKHALAHASATAFAAHGVHEGQQFVLRTLWREDGLSLGEVARRLGLATPTITRAATRMEAAGLLRREPHPGDRRMVRLRLTDRGRGLEKVIDAEMDQLTDRALASLTAAERESLIAALEVVRRNLHTR